MKPEDIQKLSDRELLIKTFGDVEHIKGILGNGGGVLGDVRRLKKNCVTRGELTLTVAIISLIFVGIGVLLYFL